MRGDPACRYRMTVHGEYGALLAAAIEGLEVESCRDGRTCVVVSVQDDSELTELWGRLDRMQDFAVRIISLNELASNAKHPASL